jgi:uncharacterized protein YbjT (DUF2867 family)
VNVILFGATGMIGQGVLRECLLDPDVTRVLSVARSSTGQHDDKLRELLREDFTNFSAVERELTGYDACFFCLGVSSAGMSEADYARVTYDFTLAAARVLAKANPEMTFIYVSGAGTDSSEKGRSMWARVKGRTEVHVSPGLHPADARYRLENEAVPRALRGHRPARPPPQSRFSERHHHDRAGRSGDAGSRQARRRQDAARERRRQRAGRPDRLKQELAATESNRMPRHLLSHDHP